MLGRAQEPEEAACGVGPSTGCAGLSHFRVTTPQPHDVASFDLAGMLRRIRRQADLSQRELARRLDASKSAIAAAESGVGGLDVRLMARAAELAGLQLVLIDQHGGEVAGMAGDAVRDMGHRRFPAHLDTRYSDEGWWHGPERYSRTQPWYTFDRDRATRDYWRGRDGTPLDHQLPQPGDSPAHRRTRRQQEAWRLRQEQRRLWQPIEPPELTDLTCTCPIECTGLDDPDVRPRHADGCPCGCDVG